MADRPNICHVCSTNNAIVCINGTGSLGGQLSDCFHDGLTSHGARTLITRVRRVSMAIARARARTLLLRRGCVGLCRPHCGILLHSSGSCPFVFLDNSARPHLTVRHNTGRTGNRCFNPFPGNCTMHRALTLLRGVFPVHRYRGDICHGHSHPYLRCRVKHYLKPYIRKLIDRRRCTRRIRCIHLFLSNGSSRILARLVDHVRATDRGLRFRRTTHVHSRVRTIQHIARGRFISGANSSLSIVNITFSTNVTYIRMLFVHRNGILNDHDCFPGIPNNARLDRIMRAFMNRFCLRNDRVHALPNRVLLSFGLDSGALLTSSLSRLTKHGVGIRAGPHNSETHCLGLTHAGTTATLADGLSRRSAIRRQLATLTDILGLPRIGQVRYFSVDRAVNRRAITSYIIFSTGNPLHTRCQHCGVANVAPNSSCTTVGRILHQHCNGTVSSDGVPSIVLVSNNGNRLTRTGGIFTRLSIS